MFYIGGSCIFQYEWDTFFPSEMEANSLDEFACEYVLVEDAKNQERVVRNVLH